MDSIKAIKRTFTMIIVGLSLLFVINMFYFKGLYNTIAAETNKTVLSCIEEADNEDLKYRLNAISCLSSGIQTISINKSVTNDSDLQGKEISENSETNMFAFSHLIKEVKVAVHQAIDSILPVNLSQLDSLIVFNFKSKGISAALYYSEIVDLNTGAVLASSRATTGKTDNTYLYEYDTENRYAYKVYTASMTETVLKRMFGILATTFLTIVLLAYAFWYFIRTIVRQKTLEEMKQDFTNNMTHELKTPISVAYSAVDTLLNFQQGGSREKCVKYLNICIEQLSHLHDLVEQILSTSMNRNKKLILNREKIVLKPLFERIANQQVLKAGKFVKTEIHVHPSKLAVWADATHLNNMINNLVDNAIKHTPGEVTVTMESYTDEGYCIISVKDNGVGISLENQKYIFDKFYRIPQGNLHNVKGYGLGLFYVKTMVEQHGGEIIVKSAISKGSEFIIKIPVRWIKE